MRVKQLMVGVLFTTSTALAASDNTTSDVPATWMTGKELKELCNDNAKNTRHISATMCLGYVVGAVDQMELVATRGKKPVLCFPERTTRRDLADGVKRFLNRTNPDSLRSGANYLTVFALLETFPCSE